MTPRRDSQSGAPAGNDPVAAQPEVHAAELQAPAASAPAAAPQPPWEILRPLVAGSVVGNGWRIADLSGVADGTCVLTLRNRRDREHRIHICRNDGSPQGIVYTKQFDLLVMNGGQGELPTDEGLARAVAEVAHVLAANEGDQRHRPIVTALLPQADRLQRFAAAASLR